ncbi:MAG: bifunctional (p)ppGpp synthetase/guanosine-3',5'-bis(diphosphate) 3'-pyrophosphohydrolase [Arcobacteraceae bacterium]|nr:bifunctional (p)ppGpp synthetase/guanosine-3',5'-bis(diphosphate) 3'-pyrophosphohydrolase [Arcobacteraceae bacterium]
MENYLLEIKSINTVDKAIECLGKSITLSNNINKALDFCITAHEGQFRKSGEPYVVHPILVAAITAYFSHDEAMVLSAILHDIVEDTKYTLSDISNMFGKDVAHIVDGLTKITEIRENEFIHSSSNERVIKSALTFRKMLIASIDDVRVLVVKLFDRMHNMLTLDALGVDKQKRISEETLVVYSPIAHRFGMSTIKNSLEDLSFFYLYPDEYKKIDNYIKTYQEKIQTVFDDFLIDVKSLLDVDSNPTIEIFSRIKHYYSIYLKIQRKGINIDEVLDLFAIRIITKDKLDCYNILGKIHTHYKPLISRFKDYIAIPKENGYQTIHTTIFHNAKIFEIQIRTEDMHNVAEYGVAAHWKYKDGDVEVKEPNLKWLHTLAIDNENVEEFYDETKQELFSEEIIVYSPRGDVFTLPRGSTAYDFAYLIHTDLGNKSVDAFINTIKKPLLTELKSGDIISINAQNEIIQRCSWYDMVKTTKAKKNIKLLCLSKIKQIDILNGNNIINTIFSRYKENILDTIEVKKIEKITYNIDSLKNIKRYIEDQIRDKKGLFARIQVQNLTFKKFQFDNIVLYSNFHISSASMDHCCHPKLGDEIVAFKDKKDVIIHHKMCENAFELMKASKQMVYCRWSDDKYYVYKMVVSLHNTKGELARLLTHLSNNDAVVLFIEYGKDKYSHIQYCTLDFEIKNKSTEKVKYIVSQKAKIIEFYSTQDAYK